MQHASADVEKMILGNKCDVAERKVSKDRGEQLAIEYGIKFMETSAKASINVEEAFISLARDIKTKMEKKLVGLEKLLLHLFYIIQMNLTIYVLFFKWSSLFSFQWKLQKVMFFPVG